MADEDIIKRIKKDINLFNDGVPNVKSDDKTLSRIIELSKMYASDSKSFLDKGDLYTSFSCIAYAHGLLDAVKEILK